VSHWNRGAPKPGDISVVTECYALTPKFVGPQYGTGLVSPFWRLELDLAPD